MSGLMQMLLLKVSAHITEQLGMAPGGEFREAFKEVRLFFLSSFKCVVFVCDFAPELKNADVNCGRLPMAETGVGFTWAKFFVLYSVS